MPLEDNLTKICTNLKDDGFGCLHVDGEIVMVSSAYSEVALHRINTQKNCQNSYSEILCYDLQMFKNHVARLHPRIETLLVYHQRPLKILVKRIKNLPISLSKRNLYFRITKDPIAKKIIREIDQPLFAHTISLEKTHQNFSNLDLEVIKNCDFIYDNSNGDNEAQFPILRIHFDEEGLIAVLK